MITLLIGLPGSGKTWYAQNVLKYDYFVDDPKSLSEFPKNIASTDHVVVADPMLCVSYDLAKKHIAAMYPEHSVEAVFFENNLDKCKRNIEYRKENGDKRDVHMTLRYLSMCYHIPSSVKTIPIWSPEK